MIARRTPSINRTSRHDRIAGASHKGHRNRMEKGDSTARAELFVKRDGSIHHFHTPNFCVRRASPAGWSSRRSDLAALELVRLCRRPRREVVSAADLFNAVMPQISLSSPFFRPSPSLHRARRSNIRGHLVPDLSFSAPPRRLRGECFEPYSPQRREGRSGLREKN